MADQYFRTLVLTDPLANLRLLSLNLAAKTTRRGTTACGELCPPSVQSCMVNKRILTAAAALFILVAMGIASVGQAKACFEGVAQVLEGRFDVPSSRPID